MFEVTVRGRPAPQGSKQSRPTFKGKGDARVFTGKVVQVESSAHVQSWRGDVKAAAELVIAGTGHVPITCPVRVRMVFTVAKPKSAPKTRRTWPGKMPDLSKLCRATEDALTAAGVWHDDALVIEYARLAKVYPGEDPEALEVPGVHVTVTEVRDGPWVSENEVPGAR